MQRVLLALLLLVGSAGLAVFAQESGTSAPPAGNDQPPFGESSAQWLSGRYYVSAMGGYTLKDHQRLTNNGYGGTLALGRQLSPWFNLELSGQYSSISPASLYGIGANLLFFPTGKGGTSSAAPVMDMSNPSPASRTTAPPSSMQASATAGDPSRSWAGTC